MDANSASRYPDIFSLTELTGARAGNDRTTPIASFTVKNRHLAIFMLAAIPGFILAAIAWLIIGVWAVFIFAIVEAAAFIMIEARTQDGLNQRLYQRVKDTKSAGLNEFRLGGKKIELQDRGFGRIVDVLSPMDDQLTPAERGHMVFTSPIKESAA